MPELRRQAHPPRDARSRRIPKPSTCGTRRRKMTMTKRIRQTMLLSGVSILLATVFATIGRADDAKVVADAKAAVAKYAGPQTVWEGPTSGPKPEPGRKVVFLS